MSQIFRAINESDEQFSKYAKEEIGQLERLGIETKRVLGREKL